MPVFCLFAGMQLSTVVQTLDVMEEANKNRMLMCRGILIPGGISRRHVQKHGCSHWANKPRMSHESLWRCDISCHRFLIHCSCAGLHWGQCTVNVEKLGNGRHIQTCGNQAALDNMARLHEARWSLVWFLKIWCGYLFKWSWNIHFFCKSWQKQMSSKYYLLYEYILFLLVVSGSV